MRQVMQAGVKIILWLILAFSFLLPASALTPSAPENRIWEIFSIGYDAASAEATDLGSRAETSTSNYDTAPIYSAANEKIPTEANRSLFGPNAEFKAAEATPEKTGYRRMREAKLRVGMARPQVKLGNEGDAAGAAPELGHQKAPTSGVLRAILDAMKLACDFLSEVGDSQHAQPAPRRA